VSVSTQSKPSKSYTKWQLLRLGNMNRPEYVPMPELLLSSLAWNLSEFSPQDEIDGVKKPALVYRKWKGESKTLRFYETAPSEAFMEPWIEALRTARIEVNFHEHILGQAMADAITGVKIPNANAQSAIPMSPNTALLQNATGLLSKKNPPDIGLIIEQLFSLGKMPETDPDAMASKLWLSAAQCRTNSDPLVARIDQAAASLFPLSIQLKRFDSLETELMPEGELAGTPFHWFNKTWQKLTSDVWVEALPTRVWVDWANSIMRLSIGLGFLYESLWFDQIARRVLAGQPASWDDLVRGIPNVLTWQSSSAAISIRNVAPQIGRPVKRAQIARKVILAWLDNESLDQDSVESALTKMTADKALKAELKSALRSDSESAKLVAEAIRYSLLTRDTNGESADLYGILRSTGSRRILTVDPAPSWIAVIASLCCHLPGTSTTLGEVQSALAEMGLNPTREDLVTLLERAGMARGSADADQGLIVQSAY
jgi:hypothetical protein